MGEDDVFLFGGEASAEGGGVSGRGDRVGKALLIGVQGVRVIEIQVMEQAATGGGAAVQAHALGQPEGGIGHKN